MLIYRPFFTPTFFDPHFFFAPEKKKEKGEKRKEKEKEKEKKKKSEKKRERKNIRKIEAIFFFSDFDF